MKLQDAMAASSYGLAIAPMIGPKRTGYSVLASPVTDGSTSADLDVMCLLVFDGHARGKLQRWPVSYVEAVTQSDGWRPLSADDCMF